MQGCPLKTTNQPLISKKQLFLAVLPMSQAPSKWLGPPQHLGGTNTIGGGMYFLGLILNITQFSFEIVMSHVSKQIVIFVFSQRRKAH